LKTDIYFSLIVSLNNIILDYMACLSFKDKNKKILIMSRINIE